MINNMEIKFSGKDIDKVKVINEIQRAIQKAINKDLRKRRKDHKAECEHVLYNPMTRKENKNG